MHLAVAVYAKIFYSNSKYITQCSYDRQFTCWFIIQGSRIVRDVDYIYLGCAIVNGELYSTVRYNYEEYNCRSWLSPEPYKDIYHVCIERSAGKDKLHITAEDDDYLRKLYTTTLL